MARTSCAACWLPSALSPLIALTSIRGARLTPVRRGNRARFRRPRPARAHCETSGRSSVIPCSVSCCETGLFQGKVTSREDRMRRHSNSHSRASRRVPVPGPREGWERPGQPLPAAAHDAPPEQPQPQHAAEKHPIDDQAAAGDVEDGEDQGRQAVGDSRARSRRDQYSMT